MCETVPNDIILLKWCRIYIEMKVCLDVSNVRNKIYAKSVCELLNKKMFKTCKLLTTKTVYTISKILLLCGCSTRGSTYSHSRFMFDMLGYYVFYIGCTQKILFYVSHYTRNLSMPYIPTTWHSETLKGDVLFESGEDVDGTAVFISWRHALCTAYLNRVSAASRFESIITRQNPIFKVKFEFHHTRELQHTSSCFTVPSHLYVSI